MKPAGRVIWVNDKEDIEEKWLALGIEAGGREMIMGISTESVIELIY